MENLCMHSSADAFFLFPARVAFMLALFPPFPWNPPSFWVELILSTPCSHFDPLSRHSATFSHRNFLSRNDLVIWTYGSVSFHLGEGRWAFFSYCLPCGAEVALSFSTGQCVQAFLLQPPLFFKLFAGLGSTITIATSLPFSSPSLALFLLHFPLLRSFYLTL